MNRMKSASFERRRRSSAASPSFMPHANIFCLNGVASITRARTSAAICSQTRGASSTKVGPISRRSAICVSGSSTKFTVMREISACATA
ncbi:MAG: hypothetical protein M5U30_09130 [Burkholderiaceae bacterium]|nr:hypothetical protein [Burkholderiaceae bacterium]